MEIRIGVPEGKIYDNLVVNAISQFQDINYKIIRARESQISKLMLENKLDIALISPLTYGMAVNKADFRIIPVSAIALKDYTAISSVFLNSGLDSIELCATPDPRSYLSNILKVIFRENYDIELRFEEIAGTIDKLLSKADLALLFETDNTDNVAFDISEEWYLLYDRALPLGFWVCRHEETEGYNPQDIINSITADDIPDIEDIFDSSDLSGVRSGQIIWRWNEEIADALDHTLQILYFHQLIPEIPGIKLWAGSLE
jgi:hypothetical protein